MINKCRILIYYIKKSCKFLHSTFFHNALLTAGIAISANSTYRDKVFAKRILENVECLEEREEFTTESDVMDILPQAINHLPGEIAPTRICSYLGRSDFFKTQI